MPKPLKGKPIPTKVDQEFFDEFILPHISKGSRGPANKLPLLKIFNYILHLIYTGCQWKAIPIAVDAHGKPEIHYTRLHRTFKRWSMMGVFDQFLIHSIKHLNNNDMLDMSVLHGDGTTTPAKKGAMV